MPTETPVPNDHPLMQAWKAHQASEDYANTRRWATHDEHLDGSLWAVFERGWAMALSWAAGYEPVMPEATAPVARPAGARLTLRQVAEQAINGWAAHASRKREHDEIARLWTALDAASPPADTAALLLLVKIIAAYDHYRGRGVLPAPDECLRLVHAINEARVALGAGASPEEQK